MRRGVLPRSRFDRSTSDIHTWPAQSIMMMQKDIEVLPLDVSRVYLVQVIQTFNQPGPSYQLTNPTNYCAIFAVCHE